MKIDWQMYEDGQLGPDEKRIAEQALSSDSGAKKELEGLRTFRKVVRDAGMRVPVPHKSLEKRLSAVVGHVPAPNWRFRATVALAVVGAVALAYVAANLPSRSSDVIETRRSFESNVAATDWASDFAKLNLTNVQYARLGPIRSVHAINGWACFDYVVNGQTVHVSVAEGSAAQTGCHVVKSEDGVYYQNTSSDLVSFAHENLVFKVRGGDESTNLNVAKSVFAAVHMD